MIKPTLLLTRPHAASESLAKMLSSHVLGRCEIIVSPLLRIVPTDVGVDLSDARAVIFSSSNGVLNGPQGCGMPAFCIGTATTQAAMDAGWQAEYAGKDAVGLIQFLSQSDQIGPLVHLAGRHRRGDIAAQLTNAGVETRTLEVYDQPLLGLSDHARIAMQGKNPVILPLFSARTARHLATIEQGTAPRHVIALSDVVAKAVGDMPFQSLLIAEAPDARHMVQAIEKRVFQRGLG